MIPFFPFFLGGVIRVIKLDAKMLLAILGISLVMMHCLGWFHITPIPGFCFITTSFLWANLFWFPGKICR